MSDDLRGDAKVAARQASELRQTAAGLNTRADALQRLSETLVRKSLRAASKQARPRKFQ
jgi:hypothetical protein